MAAYGEILMAAVMQADRPGRVRPGTGQLRDLRLDIAPSPIIARDRSRRSRRSQPQITVALRTQKARQFMSFTVSPHLHIRRQRDGQLAAALVIALPRKQWDMH
jgi:hypothetical protein